MASAALGNLARVGIFCAFPKLFHRIIACHTNYTRISVVFDVLSCCRRLGLYH